MVRVMLWNDPQFRALSSDAQRLYLWMITGPLINQAGVLDWRPRRIVQSASDLTVESIGKSADELVERGWAVIDEDTEEVLVRTFIRDDRLLQSPNQAAAVARCFAGVASRRLRAAITAELEQLRADDPDLPGWRRIAEVFDQGSEIGSDQGSDQGSDRYPSQDPGYIRNRPNTYIPIDLYPDEGSDQGSGEGYQPELIDDAHPSSVHDSKQAPTKRAANKRSDHASRFDEFWNLYPRQIAKGRARTAWATALKKADVETILDGVRRYARYAEQRNAPEYIKHPATWLNGECWLDAEADQDDHRSDWMYQ